MIESKYKVTMIADDIREIHSEVRAAVMDGFNSSHNLVSNLQKEISNELINLQYKK